MPHPSCCSRAALAGLLSLLDRPSRSSASSAGPPAYDELATDGTGRQTSAASSKSRRSCDDAAECASLPIAIVLPEGALAYPNQRNCDTVQFCAVVRHCERADDLIGLYKGVPWVTTEDFLRWPKDPPLSDAGLTAAQEVGKALRDLVDGNNSTVDFVISSPYLRCVQTAVAICQSVGSHCHLLVDYSLGEIYSQEVMGTDEPIDNEGNYPTRPLGDIFDYARLQGVTIHMSKPMGRWPAWSETLVSARERFAKRFLKFLTRGGQKQGRNFILVTHADAVGAALAVMPQQASMAEKVAYGGFFFARKVTRRSRMRIGSVWSSPAPASARLHPKRMSTWSGGLDHLSGGSPHTINGSAGPKFHHSGTWSNGTANNRSSLAEDDSRRNSMSSGSSSIGSQTWHGSPKHALNGDTPRLQAVSEEEILLHPKPDLHISTSFHDEQPQTSRRTYTFDSMLGDSCEGELSQPSPPSRRDGWEVFTHGVVKSSNTLADSFTKRMQRWMNLTSVEELLGQMPDGSLQVEPLSPATPSSASPERPSSKGPARLNTLDDQRLMDAMDLGSSPLEGFADWNALSGGSMPRRQTSDRSGSSSAEPPVSAQSLEATPPPNAAESAFHGDDAKSSTAPPHGSPGQPTVAQRTFSLPSGALRMSPSQFSSASSDLQAGAAAPRTSPEGAGQPVRVAEVKFGVASSSSLLQRRMRLAARSSPSGSEAEGSPNACDASVGASSVSSLAAMAVATPQLAGPASSRLTERGGA